MYCNNFSFLFFAMLNRYLCNEMYELFTGNQFVIYALFAIKLLDNCP